MAIIKPNNNTLSSITALPAGVGGKVLQVVSTTVTDTLTMTIGTSQTAITGLSANITPSSTSSKIFVMHKLLFSNATGGSVSVHFQRVINGSPDEVIVGDNDGGVRGYLSMNTANANNYWGFEAGGSALDTPSSTSQITYRLTVRSVFSNQTVYFNRTQRGSSEDINGVSTITLMEIAG